MHSATVQLSDFAWESLAEEAERQGVAVEELLAHAAMYYLADLDAGRPAARVLRDAEIADMSDEGTKRRFRSSGED